MDEEVDVPLMVGEMDSTQRSTVAAPQLPFTQPETLPPQR